MVMVLIVEDEALVRRGIATLVDYPALQVERVEEAANGMEAWEKMQETPFDIVLTDINMPVMDGLTLAKKIKLQFPQTHVLFLTGYDYVDYLLTALRIGVDDYLLKPVTKKDIETLFTKVVAKIKEEKRQRFLLEGAVRPQEESLEEAIYSRLHDPKLSLTSLASELGFSPNYLSTLIKKELGESFQEYVVETRIQQAKIMLLSTSKKIYEVAQAVGFEDVNYFSVRFKQLVGVTPKQFQKGGGVG